MSVSSLAAVPWPSVLHLGGLSAAGVLGAAQFALPKGVNLHRAFGWAFLFAVTVAAAGLLAVPARGDAATARAVFTLGAAAGLPAALWAARTRRVLLHRALMIAIYGGALLVALVFALAERA